MKRRGSATGWAGLITVLSIVVLVLLAPVLAPHGEADLVGEVAEHLPAGRFHRLEALSHPVESRCQVAEFVAQLGRGDPDVVAPLGNRGRGCRQFGDGVLQAATQVGGDDESGQGGHRDRHRDGNCSGVLVGLHGMELLIG